MLLAEAGLVPWLARASLDAIALSLGVPQDPDKRHTALGDALTTARCLWKLLQRARSAARALELEQTSAL
jgi:DNA polymerase III epsilon subunit-like protein